MRKAAILGLGRFGMRLARELAQSNVEVIAMDKNHKLIDQLKSEIESVVCLDITNEELLKQHGVGDVDVCVIATGEKFETTMLATLNAKNLKVPLVIARAQTDQQAEILRKIGADQIAQPECEAAAHWTRRVAYQQLEDYFEFDDKHSLIELKAPKKFQGQSLRSLDLRRQYSINLIAIKRPIKEEENGATTTQFMGVPTGDEVIQEADILVIMGDHNALASLPQD